MADRIGPQDAADDLDLLVLGVQFHRRVFADLLVPVVVPHLLGIGMGAEWPAGAALAMETWPIRSRGFMSGVLQGSWGLGFLLSSAVYWLFYDYDRLARHAVDRHLPALAIVYIRYLRQGAGGLGREPPPAARPKPRGPGAAAQRSSGAACIGNTLTACWFQCASDSSPIIRSTRCSRRICKRIWA